MPERKTETKALNELENTGSKAGIFHNWVQPDKFNNIPKKIS
jgi:hypothetical protein